jgi:hypothetical protein
MVATLAEFEDMNASRIARMLRVPARPFAIG